MSKSKAKNQGRARKQKGGSWEAKLAKDLTYYSSHGNEFRKVVGSGAYMGGTNRLKNLGINTGAQIALSGDILGPDGWPFSIECKNTKANPRFHLMLLKGDSAVDGFLQETCFDAYWNGLIPLLAMKRTFRGEFMMIPRKLEIYFLEEAKGLTSQDTYNRMDYIYRGNDLIQTDPDIPIYTKNWVMFDCAFFCFFVENFWKAAQTLRDDEKNKNDKPLQEDS